MYSVFTAQWIKDKRNPLMVILFIVVSIVATLIFGGNNLATHTKIAIFGATEVVEKWEPLLNESEEFTFVVIDETEARQEVAEGKRDVAIQLMESDYRLVTASNMPTVQLVEQYVQTLFTKIAQVEVAAGSADFDEVMNEVTRYLENPPFQLESQGLDGGEVAKHNMGVQLLFGFTLFAAMFTIGFKVVGVTADKVSGVWNRMILSPTSKVGMYAGHLTYSFCIGFFQMLVVFTVFQYLLDYDLGNNFGMILVIVAIYTFSMVSVSMLITGFVKTPEQFNMIFTSLLPIIPFISGVYMPPGTISNSIILFVADLFPLSHAMDALLNVALYDAGWNDIALPIVLMTVIGVLCMGVGINLVERRN